MPSLIDLYPFWSPQNAGSAKDFAQPTLPKSIQLDGMEADSLRLKVPSEISYQQTYLDQWQWNPIVIAAPQAPVQVPDQIVRADSLYNYATMTLAGGGTMQDSARLGNAGKAHT